MFTLHRRSPSPRLTFFIHFHSTSCSQQHHPSELSPYFHPPCEATSMDLTMLEPSRNDWIISNFENIVQLPVVCRCHNLCTIIESWIWMNGGVDMWIRSCSTLEDFRLELDCTRVRHVHRRDVPVSQLQISRREDVLPYIRRSGRRSANVLSQDRIELSREISE